MSTIWSPIVTDVDADDPVGEVVAVVMSTLLDALAHAPAIKSLLD